jgi:hypothetical protein
MAMVVAVRGSSAATTIAIIDETGFIKPSIISLKSVGFAFR